MQINVSGIIGTNKLITPDTASTSGVGVSLGDVSNQQYALNINSSAFAGQNNKILTTILSDNLISGLKSATNITKLLDISVSLEDGTPDTSINSVNQQLVSYKFPLSGNNKRAADYSCAYVDLTTNQVKTDGCKNTSPVNETKTVTCSCSHMTPFTTLESDQSTPTSPKQNTDGTYGFLMEC